MKKTAICMVCEKRYHELEEAEQCERRHEAESADCLAEQWHRDGRGLWAMRACINKAKHSQSHVFHRWTYNVDIAKRAKVTA
jgi:hypothetical protein